MGRWACVFAGGLAALVLSCGQPESQQSRRGDLRFELSVDEPPVRQGELDLGEIPAATTLRHTLYVLNTGEDRAQITAVRFEDAASGAYFVQAPDSVPVADRREVHITFSPSRPGLYEARLVLEHDGVSRSASLNLRGTAN